MYELPCYDTWKTACCGQYPNCKNCPYEEEEEEMKELWVVVREIGEKLEEVSTIEEGNEVIRDYEEQDKRDGVYEEDYYEVIEL